MKTFVIGDIHGAYKALLQCFERSNFDKTGDRLIILGDVCDGYPQVKECIDELLKITHCDLAIGNHDLWALSWAVSGATPDIWISQGGSHTIESYNGGPMPKSHIDFLKSGHPFIEDNNRVFLHGGFNPDLPISKQPTEFLVWDRTLINTAWKKHLLKKECKLGKYEEIFLGHTPTEIYRNTSPIHACNIWALDTGAGWSGRLTIMDVDTKEYWQSGLTIDLYEGLPGRQ